MKLSTLQKLVKKYQDGSASAAERHVVDQWYASFDEPVSAESEWLNNAAREATKQRIWEGLQADPIKKRVINIVVLKVAAAMLLFVSVAWLLFSNTADQVDGARNAVAGAQAQMQYFKTTGQQVKQLLLPDSTKVWLNANSTIGLAKDYGKYNRAIQLEGEAFFEVKRNPKLPFVVASQSIAISVLGTSFNVRSYKTLEEIQVAVSSGRVKVADTSSGSLAELTVDDNMVYRKDKRTFEVTKVNAALSSAWREGRLVFENERFDVLAQGFYNLYGVKLATDDDQVAALRYSLVLRYEMDKNEAMALICTVLNRQYRKEENGRIVIY